MKKGQIKPPLHEIILAIFKLGDFKEGISKKDYNKIYNAFYVLAGKYPNYFSELNFYTINGKPHSLILEDILSCLGTWCILPLKSTNQDVGEKLIPKYGKQVLETLYLFAKDFSEAFR